jgi:Rieske Fe-S protein
LDQDNKLITHLGDNPNKKQWANHGVKQQDTQPGIFVTPHSARFDKQGNIFVVEWLPYGRVTKLKTLNA